MRDSAIYMRCCADRQFTLFNHSEVDTSKVAYQRKMSAILGTRLDIKRPWRFSVSGDTWTAPPVGTREKSLTTSRLPKAVLLQA